MLTLLRAAVAVFGLSTALSVFAHLGSAQGQTLFTKEQCEQKGAKWSPLGFGNPGLPPLGRCWYPQPPPGAGKDPSHLRRGTLAEMAAFLARVPPQLREKLTQQLSVSVEKARADRNGFTRLSFDPGHGTQVTYSTPDGRIYLWYPGNTVILPGKWEVRERLFGMRAKREDAYAVPYADVCFWYATSALNPITKQPGSEWACGAAGNLDKYLVETRNGDVLGLAKRGRPPFILEKEKTSLDTLLARVAQVR